MSEPLELKKTLNLPKTDFPMKASLPQNEPKLLAAWQESNLYERILEVRKGKPLFVLHDGPPYPTGEIHLGTGLNKILKDLVVKTRSMAGRYAPYVPGRSEEHTSELQSRQYLVCRLLLEKKK